MKRIILHLDMDYFFAQIEERENPQFKSQPIIVGADPKGGKGRGVVSTCNYLARKYGIRSGMPISKAWKLCPKAIFLPVNLDFYQKVSAKIMEIVKKYSHKWEIVSLDEAYLDLTEICGRKGYKEAENLAKKLKKEIFEKEKLTLTIGIGPNKLVAKIAAQMAKPNGLLVVKPNEVEKFLDPLDIEMIPGIGPKTAKKLKEMGINKISELKKLSREKLKEMFGKVGEYFFEAARGIDQREVEPERERKSIGRQITFEKDTRDPELIFNTFEEILKETYQELIEENFSFRTIVVSCRTSDFVTRQFSKTLKEPSRNFSILKKESKKLFLKFLLQNKKPIRLIGIRLKC